MRSGLIRPLAALLLLAPTSAFAHFGADHTHGFGEGFAHPLGGLDHVLAMLTVGVLAWQLGGRAIWLVPASFVSLMAIGGALGIAGEPRAIVEYGIVASVIVLGAMVVLGTRTPIALAALLVGVFALFHGYAHGLEMPADASGATFATGFVAATILLHACGIAAGFLVGRVTERYAGLGYRLAGALVALAGLGMLAHSM